MIETRKGYENAKAIVETPGVGTYMRGIGCGASTYTHTNACLVQM